MNSPSFTTPPSSSTRLSVDLGVLRTLSPYFHANNFPGRPPYTVLCMWPAQKRCIRSAGARNMDDSTNRNMYEVPRLLFLRSRTYLFPSTQRCLNRQISVSRMSPNKVRKNLCWDRCEPLRNWSSPVRRPNKSESQDDAIVVLNCLVGRDGPLRTMKMVQVHCWKSTSRKHRLAIGMCIMRTQYDDDRDQRSIDKWLQQLRLRPRY